jgi:hypothetical protein
MTVTHPDREGERERERARVDPGGVRGGVVLAVAFGMLAVMALGVVLAWELASTSTRSAAAPSAARFGPPPSDESGIEMTLFGRERNRASGRATRPDGETAGKHERALVAGTSAHGEPERDAAGASEPVRAERSQADARRRLTSYGWTDRARGRVHIPIARAIDLYVEREGRRGATP